MDISANAAVPATTAGISPVATGSKPTAVSSTAAVAPVKSTSVPRDKLEQAVKDIQKAADDTQRNLQFSIDDKTHKVVVKVIATETGLVVRQIPDEAALKLAQSLTETGSLIFDEKA